MGAREAANDDPIAGALGWPCDISGARYPDIRQMKRPPVAAWPAPLMSYTAMRACGWVSQRAK